MSTPLSSIRKQTRQDCVGRREESTKISMPAQIDSRESGRKRQAEKPKVEPKWKPARGRGRQKQLEQMTEAEKRTEAAWRLEKNRLAARDCRRAKKERLERRRSSSSFGPREQKVDFGKRRARKSEQGATDGKAGAYRREEAVDGTTAILLALIRPLPRTRRRSAAFWRSLGSTSRIGPPR